MKCLHDRPGKHWRIALAAALLSPLVWTAFVAVLPTECARLKIVDRLSRASGRKVTLGRVRLGPLGWVSLTDLKIGSPGGDDDPWLDIAGASIDVNGWQLLLGRIEPRAVHVRGFRLRVLRRGDGSLELADLLRAKPESGSRGAIAAESREPGELDVSVSDGVLLVIDKPTGSQLEFTRVEGRGSWQGRQATVTELNGSLNGGTVRLAAQFDGSEDRPRFEGQVRLRDVALGKGMTALAYLVPVLSGSHGDVEGKLALDLYLRAQGDSRDEIRQTLVGQGRLVLDPVALDGSRLLSGLADVFDLPPQGRIGDVGADLTVKEARVASENLTVHVGRVPIVLAGSTDFDGRIDYRLRADGLAGKLSGTAREFLQQFRPDLKLNELSDVRIEGTVDALRVTSRGVPISRAEGRRRLNEISRQVRDQLRR